MRIIALVLIVLGVLVWVAGFRNRVPDLTSALGFGEGAQT